MGNYYGEDRKGDPKILPAVKELLSSVGIPYVVDSAGGVVEACLEAQPLRPAEVEAQATHPDELEQLQADGLHGGGTGGALPSWTTPELEALWHTLMSWSTAEQEHCSAAAGEGEGPHQPGGDGWA